MSYDDDHRPNSDRGAYTPPTDDDLPFHRGAYDARRPAPSRPMPMTLIASAVVLLVLIVAVVLFYRSGVRASGDAPPAVGEPVGDLTAPAPIDAQPVDPEAGVGVYLDDETAAAEPQFVPPPEAVQPRPTAPAPEASQPDPVPLPAPPAKKTEPSPPAAEPPAPPAQRPAPAASTSGSSAVQIGAFSSTAVADREYASVAAAFPQFASGRTKRVEQVTASNGSTVYRTTVNGFSREEAQRFCSALRSAGRDCLVR